ncbi:MAG: DUF3131 domain-containing protein [Anaerolineae bacterium]|nr:DUF3131 domain-containing protein [Anaerolineae bacterium]
MSLKRMVLLILAMAVLLAVSTYAQSDDVQATLEDYAAKTWASFVAMHPDDYLLVADALEADGALSQNTSPTNIGSYIWSTLAARDLGLIDAEEAAARVSQTLTALGTLEHHEESGQFYNWYSPVNGTVLTTWPNSTDTVCPFLSSVDNGWLAAALMMVPQAIPELADEAQALYESMHFDFYYDPNVGLFRGGYWPPEMQPEGRGCNSGFTGHHYGTLNSETRIISYVGIGLGQVPATHYFKLSRTFPATCDWSWQEMKPQGNSVTYTVQSADGIAQEIRTFEGYYSYRGIEVVPSWGGAMFEALMPNLLVPEAEWGPQSWALNHQRFVQAQMEHGLNEAQYGYWGFSPSSNPTGGYREYGVDAIGMDTDGYTSDARRTSVDYGFEGCSGRSSTSIPTADQYVTGVVTPHATFMALEFDTEATMTNLSNLANDFDMVDAEYGFYDAVQVNNGRMARRFLALDQGMTMLALTNYLTDGQFRHYFADAIEPTVRPLLEMEVFGYAAN